MYARLETLALALLLVVGTIAVVGLWSMMP